MPKGKAAGDLLPFPHPTQATPTKPKDTSHQTQAPPSPPQEAQPPSSCVTLGKSLTRGAAHLAGFLEALKR